mmetsp:Transcript_17940/g.41474  ORF Transcript_17940/g.41474 Transcript_17940/m.41474 type:complete len:475 (-) Transcript_17940:344-1768(-)
MPFSSFKEGPSHLGAPMDQENETALMMGYQEERYHHHRHSGGTQTRVDILMRPERDPISGEPSGEDPEGSGNDKLPRKEKVSGLFFFVTSWILFLQGISGMSGLAVSYFYKNTLMAEPATLTLVESFTSLPWTIKPIYGFLSDGWPIMGFRRRPYLIIGGVMGFASWVLMATVVNDIWFGATMMFLSSMGLAVSNVIAEGMIVEKSRGESQEFASHLQAVVHGAQAVGGIIAAYFGGVVLGYLSDRHVFLLVSFLPLTLIVVAMISPERRFAGDLTAVRQDMGAKLRELWETFQQPMIFKPAMFVFLLNATPATGSTWFYFYTNVLHFSSTLLGTINVVGAVFSLGGVVLFGKYLSSMPYRPILIWSTIVSTLFGLSQLILVFGLNKTMGIPDAFFCLGESAILSVLGWINTMPILVLAARLCPEGMEVGPPRLAPLPFAAPRPACPGRRGRACACPLTGRGARLTRQPCTPSS